MKHLIKNNIVRRITKTLAIILLCFFLVPILLYIPPIQNFIKGVVIDKVEESTGFEVSIDRLLLSFPLELNVDKALVLDSGGDTIISSEHIDIDIKLLPLLNLQLKINSANLIKAEYRFLSADSSMLLNSKIDRCTLDAASINLAKNEINLTNAILKGGDVSITFNKEKSKPTPKDTTESTAWIINAAHIKIEDVHYSMQMLPYIDEINAHISTAELRNGLVDIGQRKITAEYLNIDNANALYYTPSAEYISAYIPPPIVADDSENGENWTITGDSLSITNTSGLYAQRNAVPALGLDLNYLQGEKINIKVVDFYNCATNVRVPVTHFSGVERCGIAIVDATGVFEMNDAGMSINDWDIKTNLSEISANAFLATGVFDNNPSSDIDIDINADIHIGEIATLYPSYSKLLKTIPQYSNTTAKININGNLNQLSIREISAEMPKYATLSLSGNVNSLHAPKEMNGEMIVDGNFQNINFIKPTIFDAKLAKEIKFPPLRLHGKTSFKGNSYSATATMKVPTGKVAMTVKLNNLSENFAMECRLDSFPIQAVMPFGELGYITAQATASGKGFDILNPKSNIEALLKIDMLNYRKTIYRDITAQASLINSYLDAELKANSTNCNLDLDLHSTIDNNKYSYIIHSNIKDLNIEALGFADDVSKGSFTLSSTGDINIDENIYDIMLNVKDINWNAGNSNIITPDLSFTLNTSADHTHVNILNGGLDIEANFDSSIDSLINGASKSSDALIAQLNTNDFDFNKIIDYLPHLSFHTSIKGDNVLSDFLKTNITFKELYINVNKDSNIYMDSKLLKVAFSDVLVDTIDINANEQNNTLKYNFSIKNRKENVGLYAYSAITGEINANNISALFTQKNHDNKVRFNLGVKTELQDSALMFSLFPKNPVIGSRNWTLNDDNFIEYHYNKHIDANLFLRSDSSYFSLKTNHVSYDHQDGIDVEIAKVQIDEWLNLSPFSPILKGELNSKMFLSFDGQHITGNGNLGLSEFKYNNREVGDFLLNVELASDPSTGYTNANASVDVNGHRTLIAKGVINDSTSTTPYKLDLDITKFPLSIVNPFIPQDLAKIKGYANGKMLITGSFANPIFNGHVQYDSTTVNMPVFGSKLILPNTKIDVDSSRITFKDYNISSLNDSPISINGTIGMQSLTNPFINLTVLGKNVQFVNSKRTSLSEVFGKGYMDVMANVNGQLSNLNIDAKLDILESTNLTYIMQTSVNSITENKASDIVHFVQLNDTTSKENKQKEEELDFKMAINAKINVEPGAMFTVNISPEGKNKVEIVGSGNLSYILNSRGESRFTGQYTVSKGFARYSPPLISEQLFNFESGSSIMWSGDILNPILNIKANEVVKVNVSPEGENSRAVHFDVQLIAKNTLRNMDLSFDLKTNEDVAIHSELQSMTAEQRSTQAMNIILYKKYIGSTPQAESKYFGNPLYSFLAGQLNNWASQNLRGIELSFGVEQYNRTFQGNTTLATNYSYQVSKSFFNNRFKVIVGGGYDPDFSTEQTLADDLLNDVSVEYSITPSGSVYAKVFRRAGFTNLFERNITQTGAAIVLRRKLSTLKDLFRFNFKTTLDIPPLEEKKNEK